MRLADILDEWGAKVVTVSPGISLAEAAQAILKVEATAVLIIESDRLLGLLTKSDILRFLTTATSTILAWDGPVTAALSEGMQVVTPEELVGRVITKMTAAGVDHLPVIGRQGICVVALPSLLRAENAYLHGEVQHLQTYIDALHDASND